MRAIFGRCYPACLSPLIVGLLAAIALSPPVWAQNAQPKVEISAQLGPDEIELYADKIDVYAKLAAGTSRTFTNVIRYLKSFNFKTGPTGNERSSYDLVNLDGDTYAKLLQAARAASQAKPEIPVLDAAALAYIEAISANAEVFNEAAEYYSSAREYEQDRYQRGKELHPKIMREIDGFLATLPPFMLALNQSRAIVDPQEIAVVDQAGRAPARSLARKLTESGRKAALFIPANTSHEIDTKGFAAAISAFSKDAAAYRSYRRSADGQRDKSLTVFTDQAIERVERQFRDIRQAYDIRKKIPLQYELLAMPFYEDFGRFWTEMLEVVERNPWDNARTPPPLPAALAPKPLPPPPAFDTAALSRVDVARWSKKNETVQEILISTNALINAWNRYTDWVDMRRGPTGKERGAGSFAGIDRSSFVQPNADLRALAQIAPTIPALDELLVRYADSIDKVTPVAVEASGYYQRQDFLSDNMKGGMALHPRLIEDYRPFLDTRSELSRAVRALRDQLDERALALLEEAQGKTPAWHRLSIMRKARQLRGTVPTSVNPSLEQLKTFDSNVDEFVQAVKALEAVQDDASGGFLKEANAYIGKLRSMRRNYGTRTAEMMGVDSDILSLDIAVSSMANNIGR